jgi:hypothetical protein
MDFGRTDKAYVSAIALLDDRDINPAVLDIHNEAGLTDIMGAAGRYVPSKMTSYHNYVNEALFKSVVVTGTPTGSGTQASPLVFTTTAGTYGFIRKTDLLKFKNGKVGYVTALTRNSGGDTVTVKPVADNAVLAAVATDVVTIMSNAVGEASDALENRRTTLTKYMNLIQAFREVNEETDVQLMSAIMVEFKGQKRIHIKNLAEKYLYLKGSVNAALIGGQMSVNGSSTAIEFGTSASTLVDPVGGGNVQTTRGLDEYIGLYGVDDTVASLGTFALSDLEDTITQFLAKKAPKSFIGLTPTKVQIKIDNTFKNLSGSGISSAKLELDGKKDLNFDVQSVTYGHFKFQFAEAPILDHQELFANTNISKSIYWLPEGKVKTVENGDQNRIQIRYMKHGVQNNKGNDIWAEWSTGANAIGGTPTDKNIWRTNWTTFQGLEVLGAQHFGRTKVLA